MTPTQEPPHPHPAPAAGHADVTALAAEDLGADIVALASRLAAGTYELLVLVGELDARGTWSAWGALSCAAWLGQACDIDAAVTTRPAPAGASLRHQRADALVAVVAGTDAPHPTDADAPAGASDPSRARVTAEVVIHVRPDGNTLTDGTPLTDHAVTALLPDAVISLLVKDMTGRPIDASPRRRAPTRRQRRVLDARHPTCQHPGCTARALLQYDHIHPYAHNGPTTLDNLQRLCGPHNRARQAPTANTTRSEP